MVKEAKLPNSPSYIEYRNMKFLIMDAPSDANLPLYITELKKHNVAHVVRVCDPSYSIDLLTRNNIQTHDWAFGDGDPPPAHIINQWLNLINSTFTDANSPCIAIHCVAGLGRAPVLVAIALIEAGYEAEDAIELIRSKRKGAINNKQLLFLQKYKRRSKGGGKCIIS